MAAPSSEQVAEIRYLADACSVQAKVSNRTWLAAIAVALVLILPQDPPEPGSPPVVDVPLLGELRGSIVYPAALALEAALVIALAAAHAQHIRADALANRIINSMRAPTGGTSLDPSPRALFDILRQPSLTRVAPLGQWVRNPREWTERARPPGRLARYLGTALYVLLKMVALAVLFIIPGAALYIGFGKVEQSAIPSTWVNLLWIARGIGFVSLGVITIADLAGMGPRIKYMWKADASPAT